MVAVQLGLLLLTFYVFDLERRGFVFLSPLIFGGFLVHAVLPMRFRMPFFLVLSFAAFGLLWQWPALVIVGIGFGLIGICHLPVGLWARVALLVGVGAALASLRAGIGPLAQSMWISTIMPVLGSIFMFRLIIYLYELQHEKTPATIWERLSYFFLLPNACFLFFPVIDYQRFRRTYYDTDAASIYQKGVFWMLRGMTHLLLYRILYYHIVPSPTQVVDLWTFVLFAFGTYLLYLKVSGLFHIIIGTLGLFGFNLPETYHRYLLASSVNDLWRRNNIYWKDLMMKVFYYPVFIRLRRRGLGMALAIALASVIVFVVTWALHSYQWFWLLGVFPLTIRDLLFWSVFGGLVVINSVWQLKAGKKGSLGKPVFSFRKALFHALKVMGMLILMMLLWSLWYSTSIAAWFGLAGQVGNSGPGDFALLGLIILALIAIGVAVQYANSRGIRFTLLDPARPTFHRAAMVTSLAVLVILGLGQPQTRALLGSNLGGFVASLMKDRLTEYDAQQADRGYYDALMTTNSILTLGGGRLQRKPADWRPIGVIDAVERTNDITLYRLHPSRSSIFKRAPLVTNQWGMRDQEYTHAKPDSTYRIALLGASVEMGAGVEGRETFEAVAEVRLNEEFARQAGSFAHYEILNFAVGGYSALQHLSRIEEILAFQPDLLLYTGHTIEYSFLRGHLAELALSDIELPDHLAAVIQRAGVEPSMLAAEQRHRLDPYVAEVLSEQYRRIVVHAHAAGALPIWVFVPRTIENERDGWSISSMEEVMTLAREAGFIVLDIKDAYDDVEDIDGELFLRPWDEHPSVYGHQLLGNRLYELLVENGVAFGLAGQPADTLDAGAATPESLN